MSNSEFNTLEDWLKADPVELENSRKAASRTSQSGMHPMELKLMVAPGKLKLKLFTVESQNMRPQYMRLFGSELPQRKVSRLIFENMRFLFVRPFLVVRAKMIGANAGN